MTQTVKNLPAKQETQLQSLGWDDPWRREWLPTLLFLPEKSHGQSSLVGYSPWGHKESDMTEQLSLLLHVLLQSCDSANRDKSPIQRVPGIGLS